MSFSSAFLFGSEGRVYRQSMTKSRCAIKTISVSWAEFGRLKTLIQSQKARLENIVHDRRSRRKK